MNTAINQFSRHKNDSSSSNTHRLPSEVKTFAKQMGLDLNGLEAEAEDVWNMLTKMSFENPLEYEQFIAEQLKKGKENEENDPKTTTTTTQQSSGRMLRPVAGFSIVCRTTGNDGIKIREGNGEKSGKDFYINFCSHEAIEPPVFDERLTAAGLEIPLVITDKRDINEMTAIAIDVIVHPVIISRCLSHNVFQSQVIELGLEWVSNECSVQFSRRYRVVTEKEYMGGRGSEKNTPVLHPIDEIIARQEGGGAGAGSGREVSTVRGGESEKGSSLLSSIKQAKFGSGFQFNDKENESDGENEQKRSLIVETDQDRKKKAKKVTIQEINSASDSSPSSSPSVSSSSKPSSSKSQPAEPVIKKGFLNKEKNQGVLYPSGSSEGTGGATGGSYSKLMSRCQVIDTATSTTTSPTLPLPPVTTNTTKQSSTGQSQSKSQSSSVLSAQESHEIDELMCGVDEDWNRVASKVKHNQAMQDDNLTKQLEQLAAVISGSSPSLSSPPPPVPATETLYSLQNSLPPPLNVTVHVRCRLPGARELCVEVTEVEKSQLANTVLDVAVSDVQIQIDSHVLRVHLFFQCDVKNVSAVMSKKKKLIEITLREL